MLLKYVFRHPLLLKTQDTGHGDPHIFYVYFQKKVVDKNIYRVICCTFGVRYFCLLLEHFHLRFDVVSFGRRCPKKTFPDAHEF